MMSNRAIEDSGGKGQLLNSSMTIPAVCFWVPVKTYEHSAGIPYINQAVGLRRQTGCYKLHRVMESEDVLKYYENEFKDSPHDIEHEDDPIQNEAEQAAEFLEKVGLSNLATLYQQGKEIHDHVVNDSVRQRHLTEKQAQTVRSRIRTLNKTLRNRQPRRKQRQDIREVTWNNVETSSTGTRSRSATPDSLDSVGNLNEDLTSDEDQQLSSLPPYVPDLATTFHKTKIKWTYSEPSKKADVAHLGSENVVLKRYQPLSEYSGTLTRNRPIPRERSGSDPTTEVVLIEPIKNNKENFTHINTDYICKQTNLKSTLSRSHTSLSTTNNNCSKVYIRSPSSENDIVSFEGLIKENDKYPESCDSIPSDGVSIDELSDGEYQYLKPLLFVELVTIFDFYKISYHKRKASNKTKGGSVFGVNLSTLVMRDMPKPSDNSMVPEIFQTILKRLNSKCIKEDGILRIAFHKQKFEILCSEIEAKFFSNRHAVENLLDQATCHELTGLLKKLLRDLPDPVFTMELFDMFYKTTMIGNTDDRIKALNLLVLMLPIEHRNTYRLILQFFLNIIQHENENRMNLHNVAMITAPSLFPPRLILPKETSNLKNLSKEELSKQISDAAVCCRIMETMLKNGEKLWLVPKTLAEQARDAQKRVQDRKDMSNKDKRIRAGNMKTKLVRSSTQYEPGAMNAPKIKRDLFI